MTNFICLKGVQFVSHGILFSIEHKTIVQRIKSLSEKNYPDNANERNTTQYIILPKILFNQTFIVPPSALHPETSIATTDDVGRDTVQSPDQTSTTTTATNSIQG